MSCKNYKFEWIGDGEWRLTSRLGMVWEGRLNFDNPDTSKLDDHNIVVMEAKITKGMNTPIPTNGMEKIRHHTQCAITSGIKQLAQKLLYV